MNDDACTVSNVGTCAFPFNETSTLSFPVEKTLSVAAMKRKAEIGGDHLLLYRLDWHHNETLR